MADEETKETTETTTPESEATPPQTPEQLAEEVVDLYSAGPSEDDVPAEETPAKEPKAEEGQPAEKKAAKEKKKKEPDETEPQEEPLRPIAKKPEDGKEAPKFKIGDKEYSIEDIQKDAALIEKLGTSANQFPHTQKKYNELQEELANLKKQAEAKPTPKPEEQPAAFDPAKMQADMKPVIDEAVKAGLVEEDIVNLFPSTMSFVAHQSVRVNQMWNAMSQIIERMNKGNEQEVHTQTSAALHQTLDELATGDPKLAALADKEIRDGFLDFLRQTANPTLSVQDKESISRLYYAYCKEAIEEGERQRIEALKNKDNRPFLTGETGSTRMVKMPEAKGLAAEVAALYSD